MVISQDSLKKAGMTFREALLLMVDALETLLDITPRTSDLRKELRALKLASKESGD